MAERCADCGTFMRVAKDPSGNYWLCASCESKEDGTIQAVKELVAELFGKDGNEETAAYAFGLADSIGFEVTTGKSPAGIAATCVYLGSILAGEKLTQAEIADAADVGATSIRQNHQAVYEESGFEDHFGPIEGGELDPDQPHPWFDIDGWKEHLAADHSKKSVKASASNVRRFAVWYEGDPPPTGEDVADWLGHQVEEEYAPSTIEGRYNALRKYLRWVEADVDLSDIDINDYISKAWQKKVK